MFCNGCCDLFFCIHHNTVCDHLCLRLRQFLSDLFIQCRHCCFNSSFLGLHIYNTAWIIINRLLLRCQRCILLLQFQRLYHILPIMEPQCQIITFCNTLINHTCLCIQPGQFVRPLFGIFLTLQFFQYLNLFFYRGTSSFVNLILQNVLIIVMRGKIHIFCIVFYCVIKILRLHTCLCQAVQNLSAAWRTSVSTI